VVDDTIQRVRRISTELRPGVLDDLGLVAAVEWAAGEFQKRTGV
jgi:signal transduction histidine kinase